MFDAIVHFARMSFTHGWLKPAEPARPAPERDTGTCTCTCNSDNPNHRAEDHTAQTEAPQRVWFGGCCG